MKFRFDKKYFYWGLTAFLVIAAALLFYYLLFHGSNISTAIHMIVSVSMPIIDGLILAYLMNPVLNSIERKIIKPICVKANIPLNDKTKRRVRMISILGTLVLIFLIVYSFFNMIIPELVRSIQSIIFQFPLYITNLTNWVMKILENRPELESVVLDFLDQYSATLTGYLNTHLLPSINDLLRTLSLSVIGFVRAMWNFIIGIIISIYIMSSKETFAGQAKKTIYAFFETKNANQIISNVRFIHYTFSGFIIGKIIDSAIIGVICFVCTSMIGTPYAVLVSVIIGLTNIIPFFGPWIGGIPSALLILMVNPLQCLYFIILILVIQQFDGNVLGPKILGGSTGLPGFWVIFSITIFGGLLGIPGMVVGVPIFAVLYAGFKALVNRHLSKKDLPTSTSPYLTVGTIDENRQFIEYKPRTKKKRSKQPDAGNTKGKENNT